MEDWQACSSILSHILDNMGYSGSMINDRRKYCSEMSKCTSSFVGKQILISGSKGEGLTNFLQSDVDCLYFFDHICGLSETDNGITTTEIEHATRYMFRVVREWSPPGYCMLTLISRPKQSVRDRSIERCLSVINIDKDVICLKSILRKFNEYLQTQGEKPEPIAGPSQPCKSQGSIDQDLVITLSCPCSAELNAWYERPRQHDWPSQSLQDDVLSTPANVVAVGSKGGIFNNMEWRFCFNRAENKLTGSLNTTQSKVYVGLKMILKDYLKPKKKEITSYVMKNIVLWICESNPSSSFTPSTLLSWIYTCLQSLKGHIETGNLPYYMIPARNLFEGKFLDGVTKTQMLDNLSKLLESGASFVHVCNAIKLGLELYNGGLLEDFGWKRNMVEIYYFHYKYLPTELKIKRALLNLYERVCPSFRVLLPDRHTFGTQGYTVDEIVIQFFYRLGLFLNPDKADSHAQAVADWLSK